MALPSISLASAFPDPSSSGKRSSFSKATAAGILIALFTTLVAAQETSGPRFRLGFADHPVSLEAVPGEVLSFDVYLTLATLENDSSLGAQGWSTSIGVDGGAPELITHEGVLVSTIWHEDHDGDPNTPPVVHDPYFQDLGRVESQGGFELISIGFHYLDPERKGAVSAVVLKLTEPKTLQPAGTQPIARLRISVVAGAADSTVRLYYEDGFRAPESMSVNNYVTLGGASHVPELGSVEIPLRVQTVPFKLGDSNVDGSQDLSDAVFILNYLFQGGPASSCMKTMDLTGDNEIDISDPVFLLNFLFLHSRTPREPYRECGLDPLTTGSPATRSHPARRDTVRDERRPEMTLDRIALLSTILVGSTGALANVPPVETATPYRLVEGSTLTAECLPCGAPRSRSRYGAAFDRGRTTLAAERTRAVERGCA